MGTHTCIRNAWISGVFVCLSFGELLVFQLSDHHGVNFDTTNIAPQTSISRVYGVNDTGSMLLPLVE